MDRFFGSNTTYNICYSHMITFLTVWIWPGIFTSFASLLTIFLHPFFIDNTLSVGFPILTLGCRETVFTRILNIKQVGGLVPINNVYITWSDVLARCPVSCLDVLNSSSCIGDTNVIIVRPSDYQGYHWEYGNQYISKGIRVYVAGYKNIISRGWTKPTRLSINNPKWMHYTNGHLLSFLL